MHPVKYTSCLHPSWVCKNVWKLYVECVCVCVCVCVCAQKVNL
jgi:hypothetical protein